MTNTYLEKIAEELEKEAFAAALVAGAKKAGKAVKSSTRQVKDSVDLHRTFGRSKGDTAKAGASALKTSPVGKHVARNKLGYGASAAGAAGYAANSGEKRASFEGNVYLEKIANISLPIPGYKGSALPYSEQDIESIIHQDAQLAGRIARSPALSRILGMGTISGAATGAGIGAHIVSSKGRGVRGIIGGSLMGAGLGALGGLAVGAAAGYPLTRGDYRRGYDAARTELSSQPSEETTRSRRALAADYLRGLEPAVVNRTTPVIVKTPSGDPGMVSIDPAALVALRNLHVQDAASDMEYAGSYYGSEPSNADLMNSMREQQESAAALAEASSMTDGELSKLIAQKIRGEAYA